MWLTMYGWESALAASLDDGCDAAAEGQNLPQILNLNGIVLA